jgi:NADPH:quinone reductase-like Zn-dependent oxidoreductase
MEEKAEDLVADLVAAQPRGRIHRRGCAEGNGRARLPCDLGRDFAGVVEQVGTGVKLGLTIA